MEDEFSTGAGLGLEYTKWSSRAYPVWLDICSVDVVMYLVSIPRTWEKWINHGNINEQKDRLESMMTQYKSDIWYTKERLHEFSTT
jgi:uncharacterized membrane protein